MVRTRYQRRRGLAVCARTAENSGKKIWNRSKTRAKSILLCDPLDYGVRDTNPGFRESLITAIYAVLCLRSRKTGYSKIIRAFWVILVLLTKQSSWQCTYSAIIVLILITNDNIRASFAALFGAVFLNIFFRTMQPLEKCGALHKTRKYQTADRSCLTFYNCFYYFICLLI